MRLRKRLPEDLPAVLRLLAAAGLPPEGLDLTEGWVAMQEGEVVGHIALERTLDAVVLRSLAVAPDRQGRGLGARLLEAAEFAAGHLPIVLKTDSVGPWMIRRGYRSATLDQVPDSVQGTTQFAGRLCAGTPIYLKAKPMDPDVLKAAVRDRYTGFVEKGQGCCGPSACGCAVGDASLALGYAARDLDAVPDGANLGLGCGNPVALAGLKPGETVLDLGSGAGFDAFLAAQRVGPEGRVIGVDMTPAMIERATRLAKVHGYLNVAFHLGDLEALPVPDASVDVILSNCVVNLVPDKVQAFREAFRVLKPGGRLQVSDLVLVRPLPEGLRADLDLYAACVSGAMLRDDYLAAIQAAGFEDVSLRAERAYDLAALSPDLMAVARRRYPDLSAEAFARLASSVVSLQVEAVKSGRSCGCSPACCA
ncbi:MAG TPA: arsenite methyltransferase [Holophagaceae bacterium]